MIKENKHYCPPVIIIVLFSFLIVKAESFDSAFTDYCNIQKDTLTTNTLSQAKALYVKHNYSESLKLAYQIVDESVEFKEVIEANFLLGEIYEASNDLDLAQKYYWKTLKLLKETNVNVDSYQKDNVFFIKAKANSLLKLSKIYNLFDDNQQKIDSSKYFLNELVSINVKDEEIYFLKGKAYNNLFVKGFHQKDYDKAFEYILRAIEVFKKTEKRYNLSMSYQNLASLYEVEEKSEEAFKMYSKALKIVERDNDLKTLEYKESLYFNMAWTLYNLKDYKAYEYLEKSYDLKDTLVNINLRKELKKIEQIHNIDLIKKEEEKKREEIEKNTWIIGAVVVLIIVTLLCYIIIFRLKQRNLGLKRSQKEAIQQQKIDALQIESQEKIINAAIDAKEKERKLIAETLHDNVSALLSSANLHLKASKKHFKSVPEEIEKTQQIILETSVKVRDLSHTLVPSVLLKFGLGFAIKEVTQKYSNSYIKFISIASNIVRYNQEFEIKVFNIIQELINNILKHSKAKTAYVILDADEGFLEIIVKDDGVGMPKNDNKNSGIGLNQIKARVRQMKGNIKFEKPNKKGTKITLKIPLAGEELTTIT